LNGIQDFLAKHGMKIMLTGFAIIAVSAGTFAVLHLRNVATPQLSDRLFQAGLVGAAVYIVGRIGISIERRNARKHNEFRKEPGNEEEP
jgi:hypothetical protein